jgi:F-type H+-transporting ATPase subunit delta
LEKSKKTSQFKSNYYAQAVFAIARATNEVDRVEDEFKQLKDEITYNLDLKKFLQDPSIPKAEKIQSIFNILGEDSSEAIKAFISMVIILDFIDYLDQIFADYVELANQLKKQISIEVISAVELDKATIGQIKEDVDGKTGLDVRVRNTIDKDIIGGLIIKIGDRVIDISVKNKIEDLRTKLKALDIRGEDFGTEN